MSFQMLVRHWTGVCFCALGKESQCLGVCDPPQPRGFSSRVQVTLEVEDAGPFGIIPKGAKPPPHGIWVICLGLQIPAAGFLPELVLAKTSFAPQGIHLYMWPCSYQVCECALVHTITQLTIPPCSFIHVRSGRATSQPDSVSILRPGHSQSPLCQACLGAGEMTWALEFNTSLNLWLLLNTRALLNVNHCW